MNFSLCDRFHAVLLAAVLILAGLTAGCGGGSSPPPPPLTARQNGVVTGDFNGDGRLDVAVSAALFSGSVPVDGEVQILLQDPLNPGFFIFRGAFATGVDPSRMAAADLNGDGLLDLAVGNTGSGTVSVLFNNPARPGTFLPAIDFSCGPGPLAVAIGDLNRDGLPDIAVAVSDGVDILFQNPALRGTFLLASPPELAVAGGTFSVAVGDLDGDGIPDLAAAGPSLVEVFFQQPLSPGNFFASAAFAAGTRPNAVVIADIDRDGLADIAVANLGSAVDGSGASFSVLVQDPLVAGNFLATRNFATSNGAQDLAVADLDGDGFPDVAVASVVFNPGSAGVVSIFLQNPAAPGNFTLSAAKTDGFDLVSIAIGDLNTDGKPDIATQDGPSVFFQDPFRPGIFLNEVLI